MSTVRIVRIDNAAKKIVIKFTDPTVLLAWWENQKKLSGFKGYYYYSVHSFPVPPNGEDVDDVLPWCPYCHDRRAFTLNESLNVKQCVICGVGSSEYYVRQYNDGMADARGEIDHGDS